MGAGQGLRKAAGVVAPTGAARRGHRSIVAPGWAARPARAREPPANGLPLEARRGTMPTVEFFADLRGSPTMPRTVLIVDDERDVNDILASLVRARDFEAIHKRYEGG